MMVLTGCPPPDPAEPYIERARAFLSIGQVRAARVQIDAAVKVNPNRNDTYLAAMELYSSAGRDSDVAGVAESLLERDRARGLARPLTEEEKAQLQVSLGMLYQNQKRLDRAERAYRAALALAPDSPMLLNALGYFYAEEGIKLREALRLTRRAVELAPDNGAIVDSLGWAQYKLGDYRSAAETLSRAVELMPDDPTLRYHLGAAYARVGRRSAAVVELRKSLLLDPGGKDAARLLRALHL